MSTESSPAEKLLRTLYAEQEAAKSRRHASRPDVLHGADLLARAQAWEEDPLHQGTDAAGLVALLRHELQAQIAFTEHLASASARHRCELTADRETDPSYGRCDQPVVAVRWEDGFSDSVCELHAQRARERGALVAAVSRNPR